MRPNQNSRRSQRGGRGGGGGGHHHHNNSQQGGRRVNPRIQTFDSNGPDVRIRGTAYQINEKYITLARDAASAGDRVLAESYLQHAEHYQRFINEMTEEMNQYQQQHPQHQQQQPYQGQQQQPYPLSQPQPEVSAGPDGAALSDLDQGFLVGPRQGGQPLPNGQDTAPQPSGGQEQQPRGGQQQQRPQRHGRPGGSSQE